jgi:hypothetical protein
LEGTGIKSTSSAKVATREDWNKFQGLIKRLYVDEEKSLKQVMAIMESEHGILGTYAF